MQNRFAYYDVVTILRSDDAKLDVIIGELGTVLGMSQDEVTGEWGYAVSLESSGEVWDVEEQFLEATGQSRSRSDIFPGDTIKVIVDTRTGDGSF